MEPHDSDRDRTRIIDIKKSDSLVRQARLEIKKRRQRGEYFNPVLFSDPAWDLLLVLFVTALSDEQITVTQLCQASGSPETTALRWIGKLQSEGLLCRREDDVDGRRVWLALSDKGFNAMEAYWDKISNEAAQHSL